MYLHAGGDEGRDRWEPGHSGGYHHLEPTEEIAQLWRKLLGSRPPLSYSFTASETRRRHGLAVDRATIRRWALRQGLVPSKTPERPPPSVRRWQCESVGALWQLDVTPHRWFGEQTEPLPLFDMIDDCSRVMTGTRLYPRECLLAYLDFLRISFETYGLPASLYVDFHSLFYTHMENHLTTLGDVLHWLGITFKYASTPQAKGKVERQHLFWQNRLPAYFAAEGITQIDQANVHVDQLREHHNDDEIHRELQMEPSRAWRQAIKAGRSVLRQRPATPWWPYLWTIRSVVKVALDGTAYLGPTRLRLPPMAGKRLTHCRHPNGSFTLLANEFGIGKPIVVRRLESSVPSWDV